MSGARTHNLVPRRAKASAGVAFDPSGPINALRLPDGDRPSRGSDRGRLPPGPAMPASVQAYEWFRRPVEWLERNRRAHGPIFRVRLGPLKRAAFVSDPRAVREILSADPETVRMGDANGMMRPVLGANSILLADGERHLAQRRLLLPSFKRDHISSYTELIAEAAERQIASWPHGQPFALQPAMEEISFTTILAMVLGQRRGVGEARIRALFPGLMDLCRSPLTLMPRFRRELGGLSPYGRLMDVVAELDDAIAAEIRDARADADLDSRDDLVSVFVRAQHPDGRALSDEEVRDELVTLLMAGWETTTSALAWAFERLARHPHITDRLADSLESNDDAYLTAVVQETLRQRPVIPSLARKLTAPLELGEYTFPERWVLMPAIQLLHHEPSVYAEPHEFQPERFLDGPPPRSMWIPFGGGPRRCLGANLAELEMRTVIDRVIRRLELRPADPSPERQRRARFTLTPSEGAAVVAERRSRTRHRAAVRAPAGGHVRAHKAPATVA